MSGSPFPLNQSLGAEVLPPTIVMDPTGNFIYLAYINGANGLASLATYRIHRSGGALMWTGWARGFGSLSNPCSALPEPTTDFTGQYLYVKCEVAGTGPSPSPVVQTYGLKADPNHGFLSSGVPGSPYSLPPDEQDADEPVSTGRYLYLVQNGGSVIGYSIAPATGALTTLSGSPFSFPGLLVGFPPPSFFADWKMRFLWAFGTNLQALTMNRSTGELAFGGITQFPGEDSFNLVEDHTGQFVFISLDPFPVDVPPAVPEVASWTISSDGSLTKLNSVPVSTVYGDAVTSVAVARRKPI